MRSGPAAMSIPGVKFAAVRDFKSKEKSKKTSAPVRRARSATVASFAAMQSKEHMALQRATPRFTMQIQAHQVGCDGNAVQHGPGSSGRCR